MKPGVDLPKTPKRRVAVRSGLAVVVVTRVLPFFELVLLPLVYVLQGSGYKRSDGMRLGYSRSDSRSVGNVKFFLQYLEDKRWLTG